MLKSSFSTKYETDLRQTQGPSLILNIVKMSTQLAITAQYTRKHS